MSKRNRALRYKKLSLGKVVLKFRKNRPKSPPTRHSMSSHWATAARSGMATAIPWSAFTQRDEVPRTAPAL